MGSSSQAWGSLVPRRRFVGLQRRVYSVVELAIRIWRAAVNGCTASISLTARLQLNPRLLQSKVLFEGEVDEAMVVIRPGASLAILNQRDLLLYDSLLS